MSERIRTDVVIVGGGLAGLALARELESQGIDWQLFEGRPRLGGRVLAATTCGVAFDLGPSWFWPGQPRMARLTRELNVGIFDQYSEGETVFEDEGGRVQRFAFSSMQGSWRIAGGVSSVIEGLAAELARERIHLGVEVRGLHREDGISCVDVSGEIVVSGRRLVLAIPPRVAATLEFAPALPERSLSALRAVPTWMAGQAKFVAVYGDSFWRSEGLSGDAMSRRGPLAEIHDASPPKGPGALFGFVGVAPSTRLNQRDALIEASVQQLARLFGEAAAEPRDVFLQDWAGEPQTAVEADRAPLVAHPNYGLPAELEGLWDETLHFGSTEVAAEFGGYLEGALEAAETIARRLCAERVPGEARRPS